LTGAGLASLASFRSRPQELFEPGTAATQSSQPMKNQAVNRGATNQGPNDQAAKNTEAR
jgi:hypothetical protein